MASVHVSRAVQYSTVQYSTVQYSTVQYSHLRSGTSYAASMTSLLGLTAADRSQPRGLSSSLSSCTSKEKPARSEAGPREQSTCQHLDSTL